MEVWVVEVIVVQVRRVNCTHSVCGLSGITVLENTKLHLYLSRHVAVHVISVKDFLSYFFSVRTFALNLILNPQPDYRWKLF